MQLHAKLLFATLGLVAGAVLSSAAEPVFAHSGRTNSSGCHNNRRTGDYHCHNSGSSNSSGASGSSSSGSSNTTYSKPSSYSSDSYSDRTHSDRRLFSPGNVIELSTPSEDNSYAIEESRTLSEPTEYGVGQDLWTVVSVGDGDTVRASRNGETLTIRLACIDAPEMAQAPYGQQAKTQLQTLLSTNPEVSLRVVDTDRYDRLVAEIFSQNGNINLSLVQSGHAVAYRQYLNNCDRDSYLDAEQRAQQNGSAFWSNANPVMPWSFRRQNRR